MKVRESLIEHVYQLLENLGITLYWFRNVFQQIALMILSSRQRNTIKRKEYYALEHKLWTMSGARF